MGQFRADRASDARLGEGLVDPINTASGVWADKACCSAANETYFAYQGKASQIHRKKPKGKPMSKRKLAWSAGL